MSFTIEQISFTGVTFTALTIGISTAVYLFYRRQQQETTHFERFVLSLIRSSQNLFSLSLSTSEQSFFEEKFKYLIVTSSVFNETSQQQQEINMDGENSKIEFLTNKSLMIRLLGVSISCGVVISYILSTSSSPWLLFGLMPVYLVICYFIFKHHKHVQIRCIHTEALDSMQKIVSLSQESDAILVRILNQFHACSTNPLLEKELIQQQQSLGTHMSNHFETYTNFVHQLQPLINPSHLSTLRDMYNVKEEIPSVLMEFDTAQYNLDDLQLISSVMSWKRREYLLYLLALDVMSNDHHAHYGKNWKQAIEINTRLVEEYHRFNTVLSTSMENLADKQAKLEDFVASPLSYTSPPVFTDKRSSGLVHRVAAVEKYMEDIQAKLFLCKQDTKSLSSGKMSTLSLERMRSRFGKMDESFIHLLKQWEESKNAINVLLEDEQSKLKTIPLLPSPPLSPRNRQSFDEEESRFNRSSFSKHRLQRIQSLKEDKKSITPIIT